MMCNLVPYLNSYDCETYSTISVSPFKGVNTVEKVVELIWLKDSLSTSLIPFQYTLKEPETIDSEIVNC